MPVVVRESTRKMTPKNKLLVLVVIIGHLDSIAGTAYSNVVVQRSGVVPVDYIKYGPSSLSFAKPQIAQIATSDLETAIPAVVSPCLAPCVIPNISGPKMAPISPNAKLITYKSSVPNVPVVLTNKDTATGYQYAYAVFDDQTGDKKSQSERSDGSVVRGQYSFIQPDGFRREVVYTADNLKGFNAVVRNISPEPKQPKESKVEVIKPPPAPCPEPQNEHLTNYNNVDIAEQTHEDIEILDGRRGEQKNVEISINKTVQKVPTKNEEGEKKLLEDVEKGQKENSAPPSSSAQPRKVEESIENSAPVSNNVLSYNDIIKCLQSQLRGTNIALSPLTYILIPSFKGPC